MSTTKYKVESYLVSIYRRGTGRTGIAGTVEIIGKEKTEAFRSEPELLEIMKIRSLSDKPSDKNKRRVKTKKAQHINQELSNRRKK